ncbi:MAG: hypothetical protein ACXWFQ_08050 [Thermoanaerobaculia bacterium]
MNQPVVAMLSPAEMALIRLLRESSPSAIRGRVKTVVEALLEAAREPYCPEKPCPHAPGECDRCVQTLRVLEGLEAMELQIRGLPGA